jgi:hypothetical protein
LSEGVGAPTLVRFYASGSLILDYKGMPEDVEMELRRRAPDPKERKRDHTPRRYKIPIRDQKTFKTVNEALRRLAETLSHQVPAAC